ncbi:MAG: helix-turn-helix transcriptional regulator [Clostridia bacterium]|nr:helix-turn-helix transcriptional regulator [Clostridia bacterium]
MRNRLKQIRNQKGITQEELAKAVGITRPYLSDIERGVKTPGGDIIIRIANYLKLPVEEIFFTITVNHGEQIRTAYTEKTEKTA